MKMLRFIKQYYGYRDAEPNYSTVTYEIDLDSIKNDVVDDKIGYLKDIIQFEENRQSTIENKISQIIGQSGVVFSLAGLFIPLFFDKLIEIELWKKIALISVFIVAIFFYLWSILKATQSYQINKYRYVTGDPHTVVKYIGEMQFKVIMMKDLIYSCKIGEISNNHKASKLLYANNAFKSGSITMGILLLFFCSFIFIYKPTDEPSKMQITNLDSIAQITSKKILIDLDSSQKINFNNVISSIKELNATIQKKEFVVQQQVKANK
jgi:hypothetical protein